MSVDTETETLSLPSLAIVTILGYLIYRYFFSSPSSTSPTSSQPAVTGPNGTRYRFTPSQLDTVAAMFPQLSRRDIMWDLQRNGGSVGATTERILGGRGLEMAPPSFQPILPSPTTNTTNNTTSRGIISSLRTPKKEEMDLITRYNLQARVKSSDKGKGRADDPAVSGSVSAAQGEGVVGGGMTGEQATKENTNATTTAPTHPTPGQTGWAATKDGRQSILQRRRDEMILEARRKMMERDAARGVAVVEGGDVDGS